MRRPVCLEDNLNDNFSQRGVTFIEVLLVMLVLSFLILVINDIPSSIQSINKSRHQSMARDIANKEVETLRKTGYDNLTNGLVNFSDPNLSQLPYATATVDIENCPISVCTLSEKVKIVTVTVSWNESGPIKNVSMTTLIGEGGLN